MDYIALLFEALILVIFAGRWYARRKGGTNKLKKKNFSR